MTTPPVATTRWAPHGMVSTIDHLASTAGVQALAGEGSAVDAAVAASAVLAVTSPHVCGMGGDLFALVYEPDGNVPAALNASGRAGSGADPDRLRAEGHSEMPARLDVRAVTVPGCVDGWLALHGRFGRLPLAHVLRAAITYAATGFPASPLLAASHPKLDDARGADDLRVAGRLRAGDLVRRPGVATALEAIVRNGRDGFYGGAFGDGLLRLGDGEFVTADLAEPNADWVEPLRVRTFGHDLWTVPPNSQGYLTLLGAAIAERLPLPDDPDDERWAHLLVEAARAAGHDRPSVLHEGADVTPLLSPREVARRVDLVNGERRSMLATGTAAGGTIALCAGDQDGMAVSLIQSNALGFGSLLFEPTTGIGLQNRGLGFSLERGHPAEYGPARRPPHTLSPAVATRPDGSLRLLTATMGGDSQPQILLQVLSRVLRHGASPGAAIRAPRWVLTNTTGFDTWKEPESVAVSVEPDAPAAWVEGLRARGHQVEPMAPEHLARFGHAHLLARTADGWAGAADPRALIGSVAGY
ncbi:MAG: gamma-glutamyltransferase family protein [Acidimicrobiales bacterium]